MRVAVKKLRAYLNLYNLVTEPEEAGLQLVKTETIFNITGKYRDIEISLDLLGSFKNDKKNKYPALRSYLLNALQLTEEKTAAAIKKFNPRELHLIGENIYTRLSNESPDAISAKITDVLNRKLIVIIELFKKSDDQPHALRKELKELYYWLTIMPGAVLFSVSQIKKLDKILDLLGSWQDHQVLLTRTKHFRKDFIAKKTEEHTSYKKLAKHLEAKSEKLLGSANLRLKKLLDPFENKNKLTEANKQ